MSAAFQWHNYGKSTIGNRTDIERVPIDRLQAFYQQILSARQHRADRGREVRRGQGAGLRQPVFWRPQDTRRSRCRRPTPRSRPRTANARSSCAGSARWPLVGAAVSHLRRGSGRQSAARNPEHGPGHARLPAGSTRPWSKPRRPRDVSANNYNLHDPSVMELLAQVGDNIDAGRGARHHDRRHREAGQRSPSPRKKSTGPSSSICPTANNPWPTARRSAWS